MIQSFNPPNMSDFQKRALMVGIVFVGLFIAVTFVSPSLGLTRFDARRVFQSYLIGWTFWTGIGIGSLALLMLQHLTGGGWGLVIRRVLEAATRTLPVMAILFLPVILGAHSLYHEWADHEEVAKHPVVQLKTGYLNIPFFTVRAVDLFRRLDRAGVSAEQVVAGTGPHRRQSLHEEHAHLERPGHGGADIHRHVRFDRLVHVARAGMVLDDLRFHLRRGMEPERAGVCDCHDGVACRGGTDEADRSAAPFPRSRQAAAGAGDVVVLLRVLAVLDYLVRQSSGRDWLLPQPHHGGWGVLIVVIAILHFGAPFLFLLSRGIKRNPRKLALIATLILVMRMVDLYMDACAGVSSSASGF